MAGGARTGGDAAAGGVFGAGERRPGLGAAADSGQLRGARQGPSQVFFFFKNVCMCMYMNVCRFTYTHPPYFMNTCLKTGPARGSPRCPCAPRHSGRGGGPLLARALVGREQVRGGLQGFCRGWGRIAGRKWCVVDSWIGGGICVGRLVEMRGLRGLTPTPTHLFQQRRTRRRPAASRPRSSGCYRTPKRRCGRRPPAT